MQKRYLIILLLCFIGISPALSQRNMVRYQIAHNDPYDLKKFRLLFDLGFVEFYKKQFPVGGGLQFNITPHKRINIELLSRVAYYDKQFLDARKDKLTDNLLMPFIYTDGVVEWHVMDRLRGNNVRITLAKSYYLQWKYERYVNIRVNARRFFALRTGYFRYDMMIEGDSKYPLETATKDREADYFVMHAVQGPYVGITWGAINKYRIKLPDYGYVARFRKQQFYADFMYGFGSIADMKLNNLEEEVNTGGYRPYGWRIGVQWIDNLMHFRMEGGQRPGYQKRYWYGSLTVGFVLIGNERT